MSDIDSIIKPALDAYSASLAQHGHDFSEQGVPKCKCGLTFPKGRRSVGLHIAAAHKRADKEYTAETKRLLEEHRAKERRLQGARDAAAFIRSTFR